MPIYETSMEIIYYDETPYESNPCEVRINGNEIVVSYLDEKNMRVVYIGKSQGDGHYKLYRDDNHDDWATLHQFKNSNTLVGI